MTKNVAIDIDGHRARPILRPTPLLLSGWLTPDDCLRIRSLPTVVAQHGEGDKYGDEKHQPKTVRCDWFAERIAIPVAASFLGGRVDPLVKLYHLKVGQGVKEHVDEDFDGPDGSVATWSVLAYASEGHVGGDTVFPDYPNYQEHRLGDVVLFPHALRHCATPVVRGERFVLKTDIFLPRKPA